MSGRELFTQLRENLQPRGSEPLVRLFLKDSTYVDLAVVKQCINDAESLMTTGLLGQKPTALEKLGLQVLLDSARISVDNPPEKEDHGT